MSFTFFTHDRFDIDYWLKRGKRFVDQGAYFTFDVSQSDLPAWNDAKNEYVMAYINEAGGREDVAYRLLHQEARKPTPEEAVNQVTPEQAERERRRATSQDDLDGS